MPIVRLVLPSLIAYPTAPTTPDAATHPTSESLRMRKAGHSNLVMDYQEHAVSLAMPSAQHHHNYANHRTSRWLCLLTTSLAFLLGVGVGVAVPLYVYLPSTPSATPLARNESTTMAAPLLSPSSNASDDSWEMPSKRVTFVEPPVEKGVADEADTSRASSLETWAAATPVQAEAVDGVFWSQAVEHLLPKGFDDKDVTQWQEFTKREAVIRLEEGCGRMQNRLVTFENGTRSCCRYRQNYDQIQGEIFSFYLSRLLDMPNLPPSALGLVRPLQEQWTSVRSQLSLAQWAEERPVVFTQFLEDLEPAFIPAQFRGSSPTSGRQLHPSQVSHKSLATAADRQELVTLAQWSDLIVFDYLTANLDRMVNNLYNMQWNPQMMDSPAHNLARHTRTGLLVFLDNESGLLHGYRLLDKYETYHKSLLDSLCLFRKSTVDALQRLQKERDVGARLRHLFDTRHKDVADFLPFLPDKSLKTLNHRIDRVLHQVQKCRHLYGGH